RASRAISTTSPSDRASARRGCCPGCSSWNCRASCGESAAAASFGLTVRAKVEDRMAKTLVIVESPAKARTIERILKKGYEVRASYGHVRDLPESADEIPDEIRKEKWGRLGVDTDGDFKPYYVIPNDKRKHVQALKAALKDATQVYLATDPDREGESIS